MGAHDRTNANEPNQRRVDVTADGLRWHPSWDPSLIRNDIGIIVMPTAVELNHAIRAVILPAIGGTEQFNGELGVVSGFGVFSDNEGLASNVLRYVYDNIMTNTACAIRFPGWYLIKLDCNP